MPVHSVPLVRWPGLSPALQVPSAGLDPAALGAVTVIPRVRLQRKASPPQVPSVRHHGQRPALPVLSAGLIPTDPTTVANTLRIGATLAARANPKPPLSVIGLKISNVVLECER